MALLAVTGPLLPSFLLPGRYRLLFGVLLFAIAAAQLVRGASFLLRKEYKLAVIMLVLFGIGLIWQRLPEISPRRYDFSTYYVAGKLLAEQPDGRLYYNEVFPDGRIQAFMSAKLRYEFAQRYGLPYAIPPIMYPPFFAVLMKPLARFSYTNAYIMWTAVTVGLTLAAVWLSLDLGGKRLSAELTLILLTGLFSYFPFFQELLLGQVASLLLFFCALGIWLLVRNRNWSSAFCFAFATMVKLTPAIVVPILVFHRKWRWLTAYGCWMAGLFGFSVWQAGWLAHMEFIHHVMPSIACGVITTGNISLVAYIQDLFVGHVPSGASQILLPPLACPVSKIVAFVLCAGMMYRFYVHRKQHLVLHITLALLLSLSISPIAWMHYYVIAILPFLYLWCRMRGSGRDILLLAFLLVVGTNVTVFALRLSTNHPVQLVIAAVVPCLTVALIYFRAALEDSVSSERLHASPVCDSATP